MLDQQSEQLFQRLLSKSKIKYSAVEEEFTLSRDQIDYSIQKINEWLYHHGLLPIKVDQNDTLHLNSISVGQFLKYEQKHSVPKHIPTELERVELIILFILLRDEELSLVHFTSLLNISKNTVLTDMKIVRNRAKLYNLSVTYSRKIGYHVAGEELDKRRLLLDAVKNVLHLPDGAKWFAQLCEFRHEEITEYRNVILEIERLLNRLYADELIETLPYCFYANQIRVDSGKTLSDLKISETEVMQTKEFEAIDLLIGERFGYNEQEVLFLSLQLLTSTIISSEVEVTHEVNQMMQALEETITLFEKVACVFFTYKENLLQQLLMHWRPAYYRIKYFFTAKNPLLDHILSEYKELHYLVKQCVTPLKELLGKEIPDDELAFLTIFISSWLEREGERIDTKKKAIVVCSEGVSTSRLLYSDLQELFPNIIFLTYLSSREVDTFEFAYDVIFSTVLLETEKPLFVVKPLLNEEERKDLIAKVEYQLFGYEFNPVLTNELLSIIERNAIVTDREKLYDDLQRYISPNPLDIRSSSHQKLQEFRESDEPTLASILPVEHIVMNHPHFNDWQEAIRYASQPLLKNGSINEGYIEKMIMINEDEQAALMIAPGVIIPHASPRDGVLKVGMSLLRLNQSIPYKNHNLRIVVALSAVNKKDHVQGLSQLNRMLSAEENINKIAEARDPYEIHELIQKYSSSSLDPYDK